MEFYLDHNATTPMSPLVAGVMGKYLTKEYGNASSLHLAGSKARRALEESREQIADLIGAKPSEIIFTSGGTEANNMAIWGMTQDGIPPYALVYSAVEHKSIIHVADKMNLVWKRVVPVDENGVVDLDWLEKAVLSISTCLVSVMHANNETGIIQPIADIGEMARLAKKHSLIHTDAVQSFGKIPVHVDDLGVDLMTISAHKVGGPKGVGALYVRKGVEIQPLIVGGHQERDKRGGTENVAGIVAFATAAVLHLNSMDERTRIVSTQVDELSSILDAELPGIWVNGGDAERLPNTVNIGLGGVQSEALVLMLSERGVYVSNGSACESGSLEGSHVLKAMGQSEEQAQSAIRFSFGWELPDNALPEIARHVVECVKQLRSMAEVPF